MDSTKYHVVRFFTDGSPPELVSAHVSLQRAQQLSKRMSSYTDVFFPVHIGVTIPGVC